MHRYDLLHFPEDVALATEVARRWVDSAFKGDLRTVALSGGRIAGILFSSAAEQSLAKSNPLAMAHFFWADERCVSPAAPESNYALAKAGLLDPLQVPPNRIHRLRGEIDPPWAAREAEAEICRIAPLNDRGQPVLDLILLGMGADGHIASLFPGALEEALPSSAVYLPVQGPKPPTQRITMNFAALAAARRVWVLVSGAGKAQALKDSLSPSGQTPLARLIQRRRHVLIFSTVQLPS